MRRLGPVHAYFTDRVAPRSGWLQGARRSEGWSLREPSNAADAAPGRNPKGRTLAGRMALLRLVAWLQPSFLTAPSPAPRQRPARPQNKREQALALLLPLLFVSFGSLAAGNEAELQRLQSALSLLNQEQQAVYQQFQMVQELRRASAQGVGGPYTTQLGPPRNTGEVPNYTDVVEAQKNQIRRNDDLAQQAEALYVKYSEIEDRKKPLQQRIYDLTIPK